MTDRQHLIADFLTRSGWGGADRRVLAGDASFRRYDRLRDGDRHAVLMDAPPPQEDVRPFMAVADLLHRLDLSAPRLLAADPQAGLLLLEDLGDDTYSRRLAQGDDERALYELAIDALAHLHRHPDAVASFVPPYDDDRLLTEAALLTDWYMPAVLGQSTPDTLRAEYLDLWRDLLPVARGVPQTLVLRDFHVDNLMLLRRPGLQACGLLDFQDAVIGPLTYDLVSLLEDARRDIAADLIARMIERYVDQVPQADRAAFDASWAVMAAQRHAKVIGIFTRLCRRDGKPHYLHHIPRVWRLLLAACEHPVLAQLREWLDRHIPADRRTVPTP